MKRSHSILVASIASLVLKLSSSALRADLIVEGAGPNQGPQVTLQDPITLGVLSSFNAFAAIGGITVAAGDGVIVVGEASQGGQVNVYDATTLTLEQTLQPFGSTYTGGVTVAVGDGRLVVGSGAGGGSQVSVYSDSTFALQNSFNAFGSNFSGGVNVAVGNGRLVIGEASGGSRVSLYNEATLSQLNSFVAYGSTFTGGVTVAVGDGEIVTGEGTGGASQINIYGLANLALEAAITPFTSNFKGGVNVAVGNGEIIAGAGAGANGNSQIFDYNATSFALQNTFNAYPSTFTGGVTVAILPVLQTWTGTSSGDWNTAENWSPATVPNGPDAAAVFDVSATTAVSLSADTEVNSLTFTTGAAANSYTITVKPGVTLTLSGTGITNSSGVTQTLVNAVDGGGNAGTIVFANAATAGSAAIVNQGGTGNGSSSGTIFFNDFSSAGQAAITNQPGTNSPGGSTIFNGGSAGTATIINQGGNAAGSFGGSTVFNFGSGGNAIITAQGATNASASGGGQIIFNGGSAEDAILTANGGTVDTAPGGVIIFNGGTADGAAITINGGMTAHAGGGAIFFNGDADGGGALATVAAGGVFDISGLTVDRMNIGTIAGAGTFFLGSHTLVAGGAGFDTTVSGVIADGGQAGGTGGSLIVSGPGSLTLLGQNTYTGRTAINNGGVLNANAPGALPSLPADGGNGAARAALAMDQAGTGYSTLNLGASQAAASLVGAATSTINLNGHTLTIGNSGGGTTTFSGSITDGTENAGSGGLTTDGTATLVLNGRNPYTGATVVGGSSTLVIGDGTTGNIVATSGVNVAGGATLATNLGDHDLFRASVNLGGDVINSAVLNAIQSGTNTLAGVISGPGILGQSGSGTTILTGLNTYTGATFINSGTLQVGTSATASSIASTSEVVIGGGAALTLVNVAGGVFDRDIDNLTGGQATVNVFSANTITLSGAIQNSSGTTTLNKNGPGTAILSGQNSYTGGTTVNGGILEIDSGINSEVTVNAASALRGNGTIIGDVNILAGGTYQPLGATTSITGNLALQAGANLNVRLSAPGIQDEELVEGNLTLAGTLSLVPQSGFGVGSYPLFAYAGALNMSKLTIKSVPGYTAMLVSSPAPGGNVLNLVVTAPGLLPTLGWDGGTVTADGTVHGGDGTWDSSGTNWTNSNGTVNSAWNNGTAVFANTGGTVHLGSAIDAQGLLFAGDGFTIDSPSGAKLALNGPASFVDVANASQTATISASIFNSKQFIANGPGTLVLTSGANDISGSVSIITGTLQVGTPTAPGSIGGGSTAVSLSDGGTLRLTNVTGGTFFRSVTAGLGQSGTLEIASAGTVRLSGALTDNTPGQLALTVSGTGTAILTHANNNFSGATTIGPGTLQVGTNIADGSLGAGSPVIFNGGGTLSLVNLGGTLFPNSITNASNGSPNVIINTGDLTLSGSISDAANGSLTFTKNGAGTTTLTGVSSYFGPTIVNGGVLQIGDGITFGTAIANSPVQVNGSASLGINLFPNSTFANPVSLNSATASLTASQGGTNIFSGVISGSGAVNQRGHGTAILTANETYTGPTTIGVGILQIGNASSGNLSGTSGVTVSGQGTLAINLANSGVFTPTIALNAAASSLDAIAPGFNTLSGVISGPGGLVQNGLGETELSAVETYTGDTTVNAGLLIVDANASLAAKTVVNVNGGTFEADALSLPVNAVRVATAGLLTGSGTIDGNVALTGNGIIALSGGAIDGLLNVTGGTWNGRGAVTGAITASGFSTNVFSIGSRGSLIAREGLAVTGGQLAGDGTLFGDLTYSSSSNSTFSGDISFGSVVMKKAGATLTLTGTNIYDGGTTISAGTLQVGDGQTSGFSFAPSYALGSNSVTVSGKGTLAVDLRDQVSFTSTVNLTTAGATLQALQPGTTNFTGTISGPGGFTQAGTGTSVLASSVSGLYSGDTNVFSGTLEVDTQVPNSTVHVDTQGTLTGTQAALKNVTLAGNGTIDLSAPHSEITGTLTVNGGNWKGAGAVLGSATSNSGNFGIDGSLTALAGLTVKGGTLFGTGTLTGNLTYQSPSSSTFAGLIANSTVIMNKGGSTLTLSGASTYTGATTISAGTLDVTGSLAATAVTVNNGGILAGTGTIAGTEVVSSGGTFAPGDNGIPGDFTVGDLQLNSGAKLNYLLGASGATAVGNNDLTVVNGNVTLGGTLNIRAAFGFGAGLYDLLNASGTITPGAIAIGAVPAGFTKANFSIQTSGSQVQLLVTGGPAVQYWNPTGAQVIQGGAGSWDDALLPAWSIATGGATATWASSVAVFSAGSGTVTVGKNITASAVGFVPGSGAYTINIGGAFSMNVTGAGFTNTSGVTQNFVTAAHSTATGSLIFSGDATAGSVTITNQGNSSFNLSSGGITQFQGNSTAGNATIVNNGGTMNGGGTLFLGTSDGGTAQVTNNGNGFLDISGLTAKGMPIGSIAGGGTFFLGGKSLTVGGNNLGTTVSGVISDGGASGGTQGSLIKTGTGTLILTGTNTYTGTTTVSGGSLQIGDGASANAGLQSSSVTVAAGATLALELANGGTFANKVTNTGTVTLTGDNLDNFTVSSAIGGNGKLVKTGANVVTVSGNNAYSGGTAINAGALIVTNASSSAGKGTVNVNNTGTLGGNGKINGPVALNQGGAIAPGAGSVNQPGTTLQGASVMWNPGGTLTLQLGGTASDALALSGALTKGLAGVGAFTIDILDVGGITHGNFTLATFASTTFAQANFTLDLPGNYTGFLVENKKSLVLDITGGNEQPSGNLQTSSALATTASLTSTDPVPSDNSLAPTQSPVPNVSLGSDPSSYNATPTPEPGSAMLLAFGGTALLGWRRRRRI